MLRGCDGWDRTSIRRVTTGRPTVERRRSEMDAPARIERARVGSKPTALPLSYGAVTEAAGLEPASGCGRLRASNALPFQLGHASRGGRRGSRTPKAPRAHPFSRRDTAPVAVLPQVTPAGLEPARPRLRAGSSTAELRSHAADVAGRARTCDAPRFRRALYRLSFSHMR